MPFCRFCKALVHFLLEIVCFLSQAFSSQRAVHWQQRQRLLWRLSKSVLQVLAFFHVPPPQVRGGSMFPNLRWGEHTVFGADPMKFFIPLAKWRFIGGIYCLQHVWHSVITSTFKVFIPRHTIVAGYYGFTLVARMSVSLSSAHTSGTFRA